MPSLTYAQIFDARGDAYNRAGRRCPGARSVERELLLDRLDLRPGQRVADAPAGGGYLAEGLAGRLGTAADVLCVEPSAEFMRGVPPGFARLRCALESWALRDGCLDRLGSLAGLHHVADKPRFLAEARRVLVPGGLLACADVRVGTPVATFLNDAVDRLTATGHRGWFFAAGEAAQLLAGAGFTAVREEHCHFDWRFPDRDTLWTYCGELFGLVKAAPGQVEAEVRRRFEVREAADGVRLPWSLVYAVGRKPGDG